MRVLITGGTGSLGHALVDYYLHETTHRLIVLSRDEWKQSQMRVRFPDSRLDFFLGDVRDEGRLHLAFGAGVDLVIHAAALKRVDSVCKDPEELLKTNVLGTRNVLSAAMGRVKKVLFVSSDKAAYPVNGYGVSKAMAEHLVTMWNVFGVPKGTMSSVVRYGNVLSSRGSVVQIWRSQKTALTLTDPAMTRFWLTLPQAVQVIHDVVQLMEGGEVFIPRLRAARVLDLATVVAPDTPVILTGLRPGGEKLHETLMTEEECDRAQYVTNDLVRIPPHLHPWREKPFENSVGTPAWPSLWRSDGAEQHTMEALKEMVDA